MLLIFLILFLELANKLILFGKLSLTNVKINMGISLLIHLKLNLDVYFILCFGIVGLLLLLILMLSCFKFKDLLMLAIGMVLGWSVSLLIILLWKLIK